MKWSNLKINKCPQCDKDFMKGLSTVVNSRDYGNPQNVLIHDCGFKIREMRYAQIVSSQVTAGLEERDDQEELEE